MFWWSDYKPDISDIVQLDRQVMEDEGLGLPQDHHYEQNDILTRPGDLDYFVMVSSQDELAGYGGVEYVDGGKSCKMKRFRVDPENQQSGLGTTIARTLETAAEINGAEESRIETLEDFDGATEFWRSIGYEIYDREKGNDNLTWVKMKRSLG